MHGAPVIRRDHEASSRTPSMQGEPRNQCLRHGGRGLAGSDDVHRQLGRSARCQQPVHQWTRGSRIDGGGQAGFQQLAGRGMDHGDSDGIGAILPG